MRNADRHRHIGIKLRYLQAERWEMLEAFDWSQVGFNFYSAQSIDVPMLRLKRGLLQFDGEVVWRAKIDDDSVHLGFLVNELLYKAARSTTNNPELHKRLVNLIRTQGLVAEKRRALDLLGRGIADADLQRLLESRKHLQAMHRYGVKVNSESWDRIIENAIKVSSVVESLEKWSDALTAPP